jgi:hypothetical protein
MAICERDETARRKCGCQITGTEGEGGERRTNLASEGHQMMFAEAGNVDVTNQDHFVMVLCKDGTIDHVCVGRNLPFSLWGWEWNDAREKKGGGRGGGGV